MAGAATDSGDPQDLAGLSQALDALCARRPLSEPYVVTTLGAYRALNVRRLPGAPWSCSSWEATPGRCTSRRRTRRLQWAHPAGICLCRASWRP